MKEPFDLLVEQLLKGNIFLPEAIEILEKSMIRLSLEKNDGNQCMSSKQLGIHRNTLQRKMVEYGIGNGRARPRPKPAGRERRARKPKSGAA
ncbi:MAG TPA: helix-turn-helix domain-containing protein [Bryobacteraceae bacterium]|nr:helix-turn-helix domain-containing protein [Bryobacteraceae bacterium]